MKIRIKAKDVEIEYEESVDKSDYYFMLGKGEKGNVDYSDKYMKCLKMLVDSVDQLLTKER